MSDGEESELPKLVEACHDIEPGPRQTTRYISRFVTVRGVELRRLGEFFPTDGGQWVVEGDTAAQLVSLAASLNGQIGPIVRIHIAANDGWRGEERSYLLFPETGEVAQDRVRAIAKWAGRIDNLASPIRAVATEIVAIEAAIDRLLDEVVGVRTRSLRFVRVLSMANATGIREERISAEPAVLCWAQAEMVVLLLGRVLELLRDPIAGVIAFDSSKIPAPQWSFFNKALHAEWRSRVEEKQWKAFGLAVSEDSEALLQRLRGYRAKIAHHVSASGQYGVAFILRGEGEFSSVLLPMQAALLDGTTIPLKSQDNAIPFLLECLSSVCTIVDWVIAAKRQQSGST